MSEEGRRVFAERYQRITQLVIRRIGRYYRVPGLGRDDLAQEGFAAAMYAVDTFEPDRGVKLDTYVGCVIDRTLAYVAGKAMAKKRMPHRWERDLLTGEWSRLAGPAKLVDPDEVAGPNCQGDEALFQREERVERINNLVVGRERTVQLRSQLSVSARRVFDFKRRRDPSLIVAARNLTGGVRLTNAAIAATLGWLPSQVDAANREIRDVAKKLGDK
jgi:DNA-directed RNA polymerase specialized sigma24 family protein